MASIKLKCAVGGALAGIANGFFGAGGGSLLFPVLTRWAKLDDKRALATSVTVMLPLCAVSAVIFVLKNPPGLLSASVPYLTGGFIGGFIGGRSFTKMPVNILRKSFALLLIYAGIRSFWG
ncbi:MAG: TSUP family transporter [Oscillospiraceae bacterium]|nr:TSUP family transporter [Oscillospiraceae bacterium]